jgi:hypothetical protein
MWRSFLRTMLFRTQPVDRLLHLIVESPDPMLVLDAFLSEMPDATCAGGVSVSEVSTLFIA